MYGKIGGLFGILTQCVDDYECGVDCENNFNYVYDILKLFEKTPHKYKISIVDACKLILMRIGGDDDGEGLS